MSLGDWDSSACKCDYVYAPIGGAITNAVDIAKWMIMQLQEGEYNDKRLVSVEAIREMHRPQIIAAPYQRSAPINWANVHNPSSHFITYGLGWICFDYRGMKIDEHPGGSMSSVVVLVPEENLGIAVFTNAKFPPWESTRMINSLKMKVIDCFIGAPEKDWSSIFLQIQKEGS